MQKIKKYFTESFDIKNNPNIYFIVPAMTFMAVGMYLGDATYIALGAVFIALSGSKYSAPKDKF